MVSFRKSTKKEPNNQSGMKVNGDRDFVIPEGLNPSDDESTRAAGQRIQYPFG
jgi:hypothetical protein